MAIKIAGRKVKTGDRLYYSKGRVYGRVVGFDQSGPAILEITTSSNNKRAVFTQEGGLVNGKKEVYWHEPIDLDLPISDISKIQSVITQLIDIVYPEGDEDE